MTNLFKPKVELVTPSTPSFSGGGLLGSSGSGQGVVTANAARNDVISGLSGAGETAANTFGNLYETVKPGFNDLLSARLNSFNDSARSAIGDLAQNLSARRILGSSFGQDTLTRGRAEFNRQRDNIVADNFLKSLEAQRQLTADQFKARIAAFQPKLDELNLEASLAASLGLAGSKAIADAAQFNAKNQNAANAAGTTGLWSAIGTGLGYLLPTNPFKSFGGGGGGFSFDGASVDPSSVFLV
jgi:hypothetical protein